MQTFLPIADISESIRCLDYKRLGKQRVEAKQILNILLKRTDSNAWKNHPAVLMWKGYEEVLKIYHNQCILRWKWLGYKNTMELENVNWKVLTPPYWFGDERIHSSHRSNLLRKDKSFYGKYKWKEKDNLPYYWPVKKEDLLIEV